MNHNKEQKLSTFMSLILRHEPAKFGVHLATDGSCTIQELTDAINNQPNWSGITREHIKQVVENCSKQRYELRDERIRAKYGHSKVKVPRTPSTPPSTLFHGTNTKVVETILLEGIKKMERDVHLSEGTEFATLAGKRRGELVILKVDAKKAHEKGVLFYHAGNDVWLSEFIPSQYLSIHQ